MVAGDSLSPAEKASVRAVVFNHLAGLTVAPTISALWERGALEIFAARSGPVEFSEIVARTHANAGYLRVALRLLASCGWLSDVQPDQSVAYTLTREGRIAMTLAPALYSEASSFFLPKALFLEDYLFRQSDEPLVPLLRELVRSVHDDANLGLSPDDLDAVVRRAGGSARLGASRRCAHAGRIASKSSGTIVQDVRKSSTYGNPVS